MKKVITAIGNENINNELRNTNQYNVIYSDIPYQEAVVDILKEQSIDEAIIYEELIGEMNPYDFIYKLKEVNDKTNIVLIINKNSEELKRKFWNIGIYNLIQVDDISIEKLCNILNEDNKYVLPNSVVYVPNNSNKNNIVNYDSKVTAIYGNNNAGKTTIAINIAVELARNTTKKVLLLDFDTLYANTDIYLNIPKINRNTDVYLDDDKKCVLNVFVELIQKDMLNIETFKKNAIEYSKQKGLFVMTGNTSMFVCQNVLKIDYYNQILDIAKKIYDYIVIDTSSNIFIDSTKWVIENADKVYYVVEPNIKNVLESTKNIELFENKWNIDNSKIDIIVNKKEKYSIFEVDKYFIKNRIIQTIDYDNNFLKCDIDNIPMVYIDENFSEKFKEILGIRSDGKRLIQFKKYIKEVFGNAH